MDLIGLLQARGPYPTGLVPPTDWRIFQTETRTLEVSLRQGRFGGPYNPPSSRKLLGAELYLHWEDGLCTRASLNRAQLEAPQEALLALRAQAFTDPFPEQTPGPAPLAEVNVHDPAVEALVEQDPGSLIPFVERLSGALREIDPLQVRGGLNARHSRLRLATSKGADVAWETTRSEWWANLEMLAQAGQRLRHLPEEEGLHRRLERALDEHRWLTRPTELALTQPRILLASSLTRRFLEVFLHMNLSFQAMLNGASAFSRKDLDSQTARFHPSFSLLDQPDRSGHAGAFRLDRRGQPPVRRALIEQGRLVGADVSLRAATQGGVAPTCVSLADNWVLGEGPGQERLPAGAGWLLPELLSEVGDALFIHSVLGLNTQDPTRGSYSLGVPRALVIQDGRLRGWCRGTLSGSFFDALSQPLRLLPDPLAELPIMEVPAHFTPT